jgi:hypothetical protein
MSADTTTPTSPPRPAKASTSGDGQIVDEALATLKQGSDAFSQVANECAAIYTGDIAAAIETGTQSAKLMTELTKSYFDTCAASATTIAEVSREAMTCRTPADFLELQKRATASLNASVEATGKLYAGLFEYWSKAFDPFVSRVADGPQRLFRAFAE